MNGELRQPLRPALPEGFESVGVVGCGTMGAGIAEVCARAGARVLVQVSSDASAERGRARIAASLGRALAKGRIGEDEHTETLSRIRFGTDLGELAACGFVVESIKEEEAAKLDLLAALDKVVGEDTILATNTSSLSVARLAQATSRGSHVLGVHFFNPVPVLPLVELVPALSTTQETVDRVERFVAGSLGKTVIQAPDRAGFVINALLFPYLLSAIRMVDTGLSTAETIDRGMQLGCSHPMGPLRLADLIGLDTTVSIAQAMYQETKEQLFAPPPLLLRMVECGILGKKSGRGFYDYATA